MKIYYQILGALLMFVHFQSHSSTLEQFGRSEKDRIVLNIHYLQAKDNDTLFLQLSSRYVGPVNITKADTYSAIRAEDGLFHFNIPVKKPFGYFEIKANRTFTKKNVNGDKMSLMRPQFWERADSLEVEVSHKETATGIYSQCQFSGRGSGKYSARQAVENAPTYRSEENMSANILEYDIFSSSSLFEKRQLEILEKYKNSVSDISYNILMADICFTQRGNYFYSVKKAFKQKLNQDDKEALSKYKTLFLRSFDSEPHFGITPKGLENSSGYLFYSYQKAICQAYLENIAYISADIFAVIKNRYQGEVRDDLFVYYFINNKRSANSLSEFEDAEPLIKNIEDREVLTDLKKSLPGRQLNDYSLTGINGEAIKLSRFDDKIIFVDFWFTGCGYCSIFYKNVLSRIEEKFKDNPKVIFISVSIDKNPLVWKKSVNSAEYTSPNAVNLFTDGLGGAHAVISENNIKGFPFTILLNKKRTISQYNSEVLYTYESLLKEINSLL